MESDNRYYNEGFYFNKNYQSSYNSAKRVAPVVYEILAPKTVVDLGCGTGTWLKAFKEEGVKEVLGIDFHDVRTIIPKKEFLKYDLRKSLNLGEKFDLAISLEVAEHIETKYSDLFVENLVNLSNTILFSAAIPRQEGENHINEQWNNFWVEKFENKGYVALDLIRPRIILDKKVSYDYRQNILLFVNEKTLKKTPEVFFPYFDKSQQLLFRKTYAKQLSKPYRFLYRINNKIFKGLFDSLLDKIFFKQFFGDICSVRVGKLNSNLRV